MPGFAPSDPLVSVVIPTYRPGNYLRIALESVLEQEYGPLEVIVVDDASPEEYRPLLQELAARYAVRVVCRETNGGPAAAHNTGIEVARGDYLAFLEHDDHWLPGKIRRQLAALDENPGWGACYVGCRVIDADGQVIREPAMVYIEGEPVLKRLLDGNFVWSISSMMLRRECVEEVGCFDTRFRMAADYDLWMRIALSRWQIGCVPDRLLEYRWLPGSASHSDDRVQCSVEAMRVLDRCRQIRPGTWRWAARNYSRECCRVASAHLRAGERDAARASYQTAIRVNPFHLKPYLRLAGAYLSRRR